ncbi:MAG: protein kinase domain-containing protein [Gemmatimonadales bacterium]
MTTPVERLRAALADRYRLDREIGAGGMATVYLAQDIKHDRPVALKVLRPELAALIGAQRFLQEIKITANLQHPHILGLIDSGEAEHQLWYVMPFVDGESLRDRISREKQLPVADAVRLAIEVASALDYAHRHGVIHRDVKPENILLHDGRVLVSDFGIALAASKASAGRMTETGLSIGTPHYMSPEQAMGEREITGRSDVYSLGCVLYEMLIGEPPFSGPTAQAIAAKVMTSEPAPLTTQRKTIPASVEAAVLQALEKLPADRFGSAADFAAALQAPSFNSAAPRTAAAGRRRSLVPPWLPWTLTLGALGLLAFEWLRQPPSPPVPPVQRFDILLPDNAALVDESGSGIALSPDGTLLAYTGQDSSAQRWLYLRAMDRLDPVRIPGSASGGNPFFSPDGRWVGFIQQGIVKARVAGGLPEAICRSLAGGGYVNETWLESGAVIFADGTPPGLRQCSPTGEVTTLLASDSTQSFNFPHALPGDRAVLFTIRRGQAERLAVIELGTKKVKSFELQGTDPRYVATGHVVYASPDGVIRAVAFDPKSLSTSGEPVVIAEGVRIGSSGKAMLAVSRGGTIVAAGAAASRRALELVDRNGRGERLHPGVGVFQDPRFSPDGGRIAVGLGADIWVLDRPQGVLTRLSFDSSASRPVWSHDGRQVAYVRENGAQVNIRFVNSDGSAPAESLLAMPEFGLWEALFAPDGRTLVVRTTGGPSNRDLWRVPLDSPPQLRALLRGPADEVSPSLSPDGRWLAYASNESGRYEVYVRSFPAMQGRSLVSLDGGTVPVWSPRGDELFYRNGPALVAAAVRSGPTFEVLRRTVLFSNGDYLSDPTHQGFDVSPDGQHFAMVRNLGGASRLTVILHVFENLGSGATGAASGLRPR